MKFYAPILNAIEQAVQDGLKEAGEALLKESNARAPVDSGDLRQAGFVEVDDLTVQVGYKAPKGYPYILRQHEDMDYQHPGGGGPKFLENAEAATRGDVGNIVARHIRGAVG